MPHVIIHQLTEQKGFFLLILVIFEYLYIMSSVGEHFCILPRCNNNIGTNKQISSILFNLIQVFTQNDSPYCFYIIILYCAH